ncbi:mitochondrial distribution/morphology family 35/apoptosis, partial [Gorgonomyces haynaldii]
LMASLAPECTPLKQEYEDCFNRWYTEKYLKGDTRPQCEDLFKKYKACVWKVMKEKKIDVLIADAQKDNPSIPTPDSR